VREAVERIPNDDVDWGSYNTMLMAIWAASDGEDIESAHLWAEKSCKYVPADVDARWEHYSSSSPPTEVGWSNLLDRARRADPTWRMATSGFEAVELEPLTLELAAKILGVRKTPAEPLRVINPADWLDRPVPPREWIVPDWIPAHTVALLFGDGGAGKTTLAMQLATARALGRDWIMTTPTPGRSLVLSAEDDDAEMHRRMDAIRKHYGASFADLGDMRFVDLVGENAVLGELRGNGIISATTLFDAVVAEIAEFQADLVIVDALADVFAGDENNRTQARQFISMLKRPGRDHGCAFLVLAHPSLSGLNSGRGTSGSTGWSNSVRSRLYFTTAQASDGSEPDTDLRVLSVAKSTRGAALRSACAGKPASTFRRGDRRRSVAWRRS
jgi:hypothetical protein